MSSQVSHVSIICLCVRNVVSVLHQTTPRPGTALALLLPTTIASLACLSALLLQSAKIWDALYEFFGACTWTFFYYTAPALSGIELAIPFLFLSYLLATLGTPYQVPERAPEHPLTKTAFLPGLTLSWLDPLLHKATSPEISAEDLWSIDEKLSEPHSLAESHARLARWRFLLPKGLARLLLLEYTASTLAGGLLAFIDVVVTFLQPFLLGALLAERSSVFACGLFVTGIVGGAARAHSRYLMRMVGLRLRSALTALICDRILEGVQPEGQPDAPDSITLMEVDLPQVFSLVEVVHLTYLAPLQCLVSFCALAYILSWQSVLMGCAVIVSS